MQLQFVCFSLSAWGRGKRLLLPRLVRSLVFREPAGGRDGQVALSHPGAQDAEAAELEDARAFPPPGRALPSEEFACDPAVCAGVHVHSHGALRRLHCDLRNGLLSVHCAPKNTGDGGLKNPVLLADQGVSSHQARSILIALTVSLKIAIANSSYDYIFYNQTLLLTFNLGRFSIHNEKR